DAEVKCDCKRNKEVYSVAYDPLDGSSLVETNLSIGSIFAIYEGEGFIGRTGREMVAAVNVVYGPRTTLLYTMGKGTHEFTLNDVGEFTLTQENLQLKDVARNFAPGNLRAANINDKYRKLLNYWMDEEYTLRYSGGMAADINHILKKGQGIFTYPPNPPKYPDGKLRLLFECNPFSFLVEQAGGSSSNGEIDILDMKVEDWHQRTPIYIGSKKAVEKVIEMMK
ncbi:fructose-1,6-bisphosphatase, partial [Candidatus Pacearchaeota archaeon]|nr:fructose-1,6-bisphosphatase [Candidatus Pacearchaeota archaeon]